MGPSRVPAAVLLFSIFTAITVAPALFDARTESRGQSDDVPSIQRFITDARLVEPAAAEQPASPKRPPPQSSTSPRANLPLPTNTTLQVEPPLQQAAPAQANPPPEENTSPEQITPPAANPVPEGSAPPEATFWRHWRDRLVGLAPQILSAAILFLSFLAVLGLQGWYHARYIRRIEGDIAHALTLPRIQLDKVAKQIWALRAERGLQDSKPAAEDQEKLKEVIARNADLEESLRRRSFPGPDQARIMAAIACVDGVISELSGPDASPEVQFVDQTIGIRPALDTTKAFLQRLQTEPDFKTHLLTGLEHGEIDHALSTSNVLNTYFADHQDFRRVRIAYSSVEALLVSLLDSYGVQIVQPVILSVVSAAEISNVQAGDRRNLKKIPAIRNTAARIARNLESGEFLIVDCQAPGWISSGPVGRKPPHIAIFETSSWT
jgi:hypothetical protein